MKKECKWCQWWITIGGGGEKRLVGMCFRYPPNRGKDLERIEAPMTFDMDFCGEWKLKDSNWYSEE